MVRGTRQVLLVDDDRASILVLARVASRLGCHCVTARCGATAFREFVRDRFDLVITDLNMPGGDGGVLSRRIRACSDVPILVATAADAESARAFGISGLEGVRVLHKPLAPAVLREAIESALAVPTHQLQAVLTAV